MLDKKVNILIIEDSENDAILLVENLRRNGIDCSYKIVYSKEDFKEKIAKDNFDVIVDDYKVPGFEAPEALQVLKNCAKDIPFIVVSGYLSSEDVIKILKLGAKDYVDKSNLTRLAHAIIREIKDAQIRKQKKDYELELIRSAENLKKAFEQTIEVISIILEKKDPYTSGHQKRVAVLASKIAEKLSLSLEMRNIIYYTSLIHDIGKIVIPTSILSKPIKLTQLEIDLIRTHPEEGYEILKNNDFLKRFGEIIYQHHERLNGSGYPRGLKEKEICIEAKIIAVADVFEAMLSHRPYRPALGVNKAIDEMEKFKGKLYEYNAAKACIQIFKENRFNF